MIDILLNILWWVFGIIGVLAFCYSIYRILYWRAKKAAQQFFAIEQSKLEREKTTLQDGKIEFAIQNNQRKEEHTKIIAELNSQIQKAKEEHINALKIKEQVHYELRREFKINQQLRDNLHAVRQRAKRFAKKVKTEV